MLGSKKLLQLPLWAQMLSIYWLARQFRYDLRSSNWHDQPLPLFSGEEASSPVIVIGMHRSGTSLLTRLLQRLGLWMGKHQGTDTNEAIFFQTLNYALFSVAHARWDQPTAIHYVLNQSALCNVLAHRLYHECKSPRTLSYFGWQQYVVNPSLHQFSQPWGWKDPRNTFTLPIWLRVFPQAKVVHIYRNGIDVSHSLVLREQIPSCSGGEMSIRCCQYDSAFDLWAEYMEMAHQQLQPLPQFQKLEIAYETLITQPTQSLHRLSQFCGTPRSPLEVETWAAECRRDRTYAFVNHPNLVKFYYQRQQHPMMKAYGYSDLAHRLSF
ncbi:MAG: sulfotransferase [Acaryochloris sp. RU_4_1]|nr:sulfotransferase [Acaryochloris sp. RU_4_1]NJR56995.1 sulfotransferase [Acaryochloris sp. CRU_2_0]